MKSSTSQPRGLLRNSFRRKLSSKYRSSESDTGSVQSLILSMAPSSLDLGQQLTVRCESLPIVETDESFIQKLRKSPSLNVRRKPEKAKKSLTDTILHQTFSSPPISCINSYEQPSDSSRDSSPNQRDSCLSLLILQPKLSSEIEKQPEKKECPPPPRPLSPLCLSPSIQISSERYNQFKQRQIELDNTATKFMENIKTKTNEILNLIPKYWSQIKQISLNKYQPQTAATTTNFSLLDYLLNSTSCAKPFDHYLEENDAINGAYEILSRTINTIYNDEFSRKIAELFDNEEKSMLESLNYQFECLLSSYKDELSFIRERINYYKINLNDANKFNWIQIIQIDYPCLIEKLSNDSSIKIPSIEKILLDMLRNMKISLIRAHVQK